MSTDSRTDPGRDDPDEIAAEDGTVAEAEVAALRNRVAELEDEVSRVAEASEGDATGDRKRMTIVATKCTLDMAYPPLILASTVAAFGWDVRVFCTFWGLELLHDEKSRGLRLSAVGNPGLSMPNALAVLPGMDALTTRMLHRRIEANGVATVRELLGLAVETGVELHACQMTMDLFGYDEDEFAGGVTTGVGAATALQHMADSDVQLLVRRRATPAPQPD